MLVFAARAGTGGCRRVPKTSSASSCSAMNRRRRVSSFPMGRLWIAVVSSVDFSVTCWFQWRALVVAMELCLKHDQLLTVFKCSIDAFYAGIFLHHILRKVRHASPGTHGEVLGSLDRLTAWHG